MSFWFTESADVILAVDTLGLYDQKLNLAPTLLLLAADFPTHTILFNIYQPAVGYSVDDFVAEWQLALQRGLIDLFVGDVISLKAQVSLSEVFSIIRQQRPIHTLAALGFYHFLEPLLKSVCGCDIMEAFQLHDENVLDITTLSLAYVMGTDIRSYPHCRALYNDLLGTAHPCGVSGYNLRLMAERFGITARNFSNCAIRVAVARAVLDRLQKEFSNNVSHANRNSASIE